jgi:hypothetical protein
MRIVVDTNVVVSALLWGGAPRAVLAAAREHRIALYTSAPLIAELEDVLDSIGGCQHSQVRLACLCFVPVLAWFLARGRPADWRAWSM